MVPPEKASQSGTNTRKARLRSEQRGASLRRERSDATNGAPGLTTRSKGRYERKKTLHHGMVKPIAADGVSMVGRRSSHAPRNYRPITLPSLEVQKTAFFKKSFFDRALGIRRHPNSIVSGWTIWERRNTCCFKQQVEPCRRCSFRCSSWMKRRTATNIPLSIQRQADHSKRNVRCPRDSH